MQPPLPAATWEAEVTKMRKTLGAPIPDASAALIVKYLQAHYTPVVLAELPEEELHVVVSVVYRVLIELAAQPCYE